MNSKPPIQKLHIRLIQPGIDKFESTLIKPRSLTSYSLLPTLSFRGKLFIAKPTQGVPPWLEFVGSGTVDTIEKMANRTNAAVLIIRVKGRLFALTFSHGWHLLRTEFLVPDFGLKVALNGLAPGSLRSLDSFSIEDQTVHRRAQSSNLSGLEVFGIDSSRDILRAVTGRPRAEVSFESISGCEAVAAISARVAFSNLDKCCSELLELYQSRAYKRIPEFAWVDKIRRVKNPELTEELNSEVVDKLQKRKFKNFHLAPPEPIEWERIDGFKYFKKSNDIVVDLQLDELVAFLPSTPLSVELLKSKKILVCQDGDDAPKLSWSLYKCLVCEIEKEKHTYVLSTGAWFEIDKNFAMRIKRHATELPRSNIKLPKLLRLKNGKFESEEDYNKRAQDSSSSLICLDRQLVKCESANKSIEVCDLFSSDAAFVHCKRRGASSLLSHLFAQGRISAESLLSDSKFRAGAREIISTAKTSWVDKLPKSRLSPSKHEIVFCVLGTNSSQPAGDLPYFSQLNLVRTAQSLENLGFRVSVLGVPVEDEI